MSRRMIFPLIFGIGGIAILLWLGFWQLSRLEWKEQALAEIDAKMTAPAIELPLNPNKDEHNRVSVEAKVLIGFAEAHVLTSQKFQGPGYLVVTPALTKPDNRKIIVDMGFIPEAQKNSLRAPVELTVTGNLLWPNEVDSFTPEPNLERNIWFARDLPRLATHFDTEEVLIVAREISDGKFATQPVAIGHDIPNDHLEYAITWFSLAIVWFGMTGFLLWRIRRQEFGK